MGVASPPTAAGDGEAAGVGVGMGVGMAGGDGEAMAAAVGDAPALRWTLGTRGVGVGGEKGETVGVDPGTARRLPGADTGAPVSSGGPSDPPRPR